MINKIITNSESQIQELDISNDDSTRLGLVNILESFNRSQFSFKMNEFDSDIMKNCKKPPAFLRDNPHLLVVRAGNGNVTVLMDKEDYILKTINLLKDTAVYKNHQKR